VADADTNELPSPAAAIAQAGAINGDAVADLAELLDVDMDHLAGSLPLMATGRLGRFQSAQPREAQAFEDTARRAVGMPTSVTLAKPVSRLSRTLEVSITSVSSAGAG
jgi:hypothetical protein